MCDLIAKLLEKNPKDRLGASEADFNEIMNHALFKHIDREKLLKKEYIMPFKPKPKSDLHDVHQLSQNSYISTPNR